MREGIRQFRKGIRNRKGKKDKEQTRQIKYNLHKEADLTWENALDVACRYEAAHDLSSDSSASSSSSSEEEKEKDDDLVDALSDKKKKRSKKSKKKSSKVGAVEHNEFIATLADKVEINARDIKGVKSAQERLDTNVTEWKNETSSRLDNQSSALAEILKEVRGNRQQPQQQQQQQTYYNCQPYRQQNPNRPNQYVWKGRVGQTQQTGFRYNRSTPATYPATAAAAPAVAAPAAAAQPQAAAAPATVAYVESVDPAAQLLGAEGGGTITVPVGQFYELCDRAGEEVDDNDIISAVENLNFH